jgi:hypothetical protein
MEYHTWTVLFSEEFDEEFTSFPVDLQDKVLEKGNLLETYGPMLGRPDVDTLKGSQYPNMKELRVTVPSGEWRIAFAFDPRRRGVFLAAISKSGSSARQYTELTRTADKRFTQWLSQLPT